MTHQDHVIGRGLHRARQGLHHRLLSASFGLVPMAGFGWHAWREGGWMPWLPCAAGLLAAVLGFLSPTILTRGWNRPFPSAAHLDLLGRRTQRALGLIAISLVVAPFLVRLLMLP